MKYLPKDKGTWLRLIAIVVTFVNLFLVQSGKSPIPFDETAVGQWVSLTLAAIAGGVGYYKNNQHTSAGEVGTNITRNIKKGVTDLSLEREPKGSSGPRG